MFDFAERCQELARLRVSGKTWAIQGSVLLPSAEAVKADKVQERKVDYVDEAYMKKTSKAPRIFESSPLEPQGEPLIAQRPVFLNVYDCGQDLPQAPSLFKQTCAQELAIQTFNQAFQQHECRKKAPVAAASAMEVLAPKCLPYRFAGIFHAAAEASGLEGEVLCKNES